jgi:hypothetical protein
VTRAQEYALKDLHRETERMLELAREVLAMGRGVIVLNSEIERAEKKLGLQAQRVSTAWTCYGQGEYREAVMALMDS